jgi:hypothetical protein
MSIVADKLAAEVAEKITLRKLVIGILISFGLFIVWRNRYGIKKFFFEGKAPNRGSEDQLNIPIPESRKSEIQSLAAKLEQDINNTPWINHDYPIYKQALGYADNEIVYLADYYKQNLSPSESLYDAIEGEYYTWDWYYETWPYELQSRLAEVGKK